MAAIAVNDLFVKRDGTEVLQGISFTVDPGSVYALLGGNGAGKSTTLLTLLGFLSPDRGAATVLDMDVAKQVDRVRQQIAYLPEAATLYPHLNAYENLEYFLDLAGMKTTRTQLDKTLDEVGLGTWIIIPKACARKLRLRLPSCEKRQCFYWTNLPRGWIQ